MKTNIALIGFMGVGKTTIGKMLAEKLNREFIELDSVIQEKAHKSIAEIFERTGEIAFRDFEMQAIKDISEKENIIIDCGGGVVLNYSNILRLKQKSRIIYLMASISVLKNRILLQKISRPLLNVTNPDLVIAEMIRFRKPFYELALDFSVDTSRMSTESIVQHIISKLENDEGFNLEK